MMKKLFGLALLITVMLCFHSNQATAQSPCGVPDGWMVGDANTNAGVPTAPAVTTFASGCSVFDPFAAGFTVAPIFPVDDITTAFIITQTVDLGDGTTAEVVVGTVLEGETFDFEGTPQFTTAPAAGTFNVFSVVFCQDEVDAATGNFLVGGIIGAMGGENIREVFQLVETEASVSPAPPLTLAEVNGLFQSPTISSFLGFPIAYDVSEEDPYQITFSDDPADCPVDCEASIGTPAYPVDLVACPNDLITVSFDGNASVEDGFTTIVVVTTVIPLLGTDPIIAGGSEDNSGEIDVALNGLGDADVLDLTGGNYTLHVFNLAVADSDAFLTAFGDLAMMSESGLVSVLDLGAALDAAGVCYDIDLTGQPFTVVGEDDPACSFGIVVDGGLLALAGSGDTIVSGCAGSDALASIDVETTGTGTVSVTGLSIAYDATQGVSGLAGAGAVYMHSGAGDSPGSAWQYCVGNWGGDDGAGEMSSMGGDLWNIDITFDDYYANPALNAGGCGGGVMAAGTTVTDIGLVFRDAAGGSTGKDDNDQDIYIREIDTGAPVVLNTDGTPFGGVTATANVVVDGYTFIITDDNDNILAGPTLPPFDLSSAPAGTCRIWGVSYEGDLINVTNGLPLSGISADTLDLSDNFIEVERLEAPVVTVMEECDEATGEFTLTMTVSGGQAPYQSEGVFSFGDEDMYMGDTVSTQLADGETYTIAVTGALGAGCAAAIVTGEVVCSKCDNDAGTMGTDPLVACADGMINPVFNQDSTMQAGSVALLVVHTSETEMLGTSLAQYIINPGSAIEPIFFADLIDGVLGTTYYASLVVAVLDDNGDVDFADECTKVAIGQPITFFDGEPTVATVDVVCDDVTGEATVTLSAAPGNYNVSGTFTFDAAAGDPWDGGAVSVTLTDSDVYDITVIDVDSDCPAPFTESAEIVCTKCDITDLIIVETDCDQNSGDFTLTISAPLGTYDVSGTFMFDAANGNAWDGSPVSVVLAGGDPYAFTIIDFVGDCPNPADFSGIAVCDLCENDPGTVVGAGGAPVVLCTGESVTAQSDAAPFIEDGSVGFWAVHTSPDASAGTILAMNNSGTFTFADLDGGVVGETYYISFAVFPLDDDGNIDFDATCSGVAPGLPVQFTPGVEPNPDMPNGYSLDCNGTTGLADIMISFVSDNAPISIVTSFGASFTDVASGEVVNDIIANGDFSITATDAAGCSITVTGSVDCVKTAVEWLPLSGEVLDRGNLLKWGTGSEENNDYFEVLRSSDGVNFESVGQIDGAGTTFTFNTYDFLDNRAPVGLSYYQIKQVDFDGASTTSNIISLTRSETGFGIHGVAPVPANDYVEVTFSTPNQVAITATVYDVAGRVLTTINNEANAGVNALRVNTNALSPGVYFIHIVNNEQTEIVKFVKE